MADMDPVAIAQSGVDPMTGSPLSANVRKALFKSATISSSVFGRGGALVKSQSSTLSSDSLGLIQSNADNISNISSQITSLQSEISNLTSTLNNISSIITNESAVEQQRLKAVEDSERKLAEQQIRLGKENELERKIQSAIFAPVQKVTQESQGLFDRIKNALLFMLTGWFTNQGINLLKAYKDGNSKKFDEIRNTILKNLFYAGLTFIGIKSGFGLFMNALKGITFKMAGFIGRIISMGVGAAGRGIKGAAGAAASFLGMGGKPGGATAAGEKPGSPKPGGGKPGGGKPAGGLGTGILGIKDAFTGDWGGAALAGGAFLPGPAGKAFKAAAWGKELLVDTGIMSNVFGGSKDKSTAPESSSAPAPAAKMAPTASAETPKAPTPAVVPAAQPSTPMTPAASNLTSVSFNPQVNLTGSEEKPSSASVSPSGESTATTNASNLKAQPAMVANPPSSMPNVGPAPEPSPNVVIASPQSQGNAASPPSLSNQPSTNVPMIKSSNPDNFYVMYSQINYNVVA
jgi:hypothetical protein